MKAHAMKRLSVLISIICILGLASGCKKDDGPTQPVQPPGFQVTPSTLTVAMTRQATATISGGQRPYQIETNPDPSIATATITDSTLVIMGGQLGNTLVSVRDSSNPVKVVSVPISVVPISEVEPNDQLAQQVGSLSPFDLFVNGAAANDTDVDRFAITIAAGTNLHVSVAWQGTSDLNIGVMNPNGIMISYQGGTAANPERCTLPSQGAGTYVIEITSTTAASTGYTLTIGPR